MKKYQDYEFSPIFIFWHQNPEKNNPWKKKVVGYFQWKIFCFISFLWMVYWWDTWKNSKIGHFWAINRSKPFFFQRNLSKMVIFGSFLVISQLWDLIKTWGFPEDDSYNHPDSSISPHDKFTKPHLTQPLQNDNFGIFLLISQLYDLIEAWGFHVMTKVS